MNANYQKWTPYYISAFGFTAGSQILELWPIVAEKSAYHMEFCPLALSRTVLVAKVHISGLFCHQNLPTLTNDPICWGFCMGNGFSHPRFCCSMLLRNICMGNGFNHTIPHFVVPQYWEISVLWNNTFWPGLRPLDPLL